MKGGNIISFLGTRGVVITYFLSPGLNYVPKSQSSDILMVLSSIAP